MKTIPGGVIFTIIISLLIGIAAGFFIRKYIAEMRIQSAEKEADNILRSATWESENKKKEALLEAKEQAHQIREEVEKECRERRTELQNTERRLTKKEENLESKEQDLDNMGKEIATRTLKLEEKEKEIQDLKVQQRQTLEQLAELSSQEAREFLLQQVEKEIEHETAKMINQLEKEARDVSERKARSIISTSIQRYAADHVAETTVSVVSLPSDEMKGRIIGREGRNIRALESLTGIDLIIDDTPEAVILSGFDPIRREIARIALEKLIVDGRIHPARIEQMVEKAKKEIEFRILEEGEQAVFNSGMHGINEELVKLLGRLKYRTSYGQNVLQHSLEVSHLSGMMAAEIGADVKIAKRGGLLHDIGKAIDHEVEGPHVKIGLDVCKKYGEKKEILQAIAAHHGDVEPETIEAVLVAASDALSAARPGARRETLESYIKRLETLENIADSFDGVEKAYAIQAGREIRIIVQPDKILDSTAPKLARDVVKGIEEDLDYPGQIKVTVIRETRAVDYAR